jgi:hypothetical protein
MIDKKHRAVFYQALSGFAQLILIETATGALKPTPSQVCQLALSTLDRSVDHFTKLHNFQLDANTLLFSEYKTATDDALSVWTLGSVDAAYCTEHADGINKLTILMFETCVLCWLKRCHIMNEKEKASTLLDSMQRSFFKETSTKEAAKALALEKSIDKSKMDCIISHKIASENKALHTQLNKIETLLCRSSITDTQKNSQGGAKPTRPSNKKTNTKKKAPPPHASTRKKTANNNIKNLPKPPSLPMLPLKKTLTAKAKTRRRRKLATQARRM